MCLSVSTRASQRPNQAELCGGRDRYGYASGSSADSPSSPSGSSSPSGAGFGGAVCVEPCALLFGSGGVDVAVAEGVPARRPMRTAAAAANTAMDALHAEGRLC